MNLFITSEATIDLENEKLTSLGMLEIEFNRINSDIENTKFSDIGIICIIMNPRIATPFPGGVIYRKSRKMIDIKVNIEFSEWISCGEIDQMRIVIENTLCTLIDSNNPHINKDEIDFLIGLLRDSFKSACGII